MATAAVTTRPHRVAELWAMAFNAGSDARIAGQPITACPYDATGRVNQERELWKAGWRSVHREWGLDAKWPVRALPAVAGRGKEKGDICGM
jgi:ribosome modulation factor